MLYITGDTHGEVSRFQYIDRCGILMPDDLLLVAGDFGCVFTAGRRDEEKLDALARLPFTILFIDGNRECFPALRAYPEKLWSGGRVHRLRRNVLHLMRGQVFTIEGRTLFTMGGGYSLDCARRVPGVDWWPQDELPTPDEYDQARANLARCGHRVDLIVSHAAPDRTMDYLLSRHGMTGRALPELQLNCFLQEVSDAVTYGHWYFGHMHLDEDLWHDQTALYYALYRTDTHEPVPLETGLSRS